MNLKTKVIQITIAIIVPGGLTALAVYELAKIVKRRQNGNDSKRSR